MVLTQVKLKAKDVKLHLYSCLYFDLYKKQMIIVNTINIDLSSMIILNNPIDAKIMK